MVAGDSLLGVLAGDLSAIMGAPTAGGALTLRPVGVAGARGVPGDEVRRYLPSMPHGESQLSGVARGDLSQSLKQSREEGERVDFIARSAVI